MENEKEAMIYVLPRDGDQTEIFDAQSQFPCLDSFSFLRNVGLMTWVWISGILNLSLNVLHLPRIQIVLDML